MSNESSSEDDQITDPIPEVLIIEQHSEDQEDQGNEEEQESSEIPNSSVLQNNVYVEEKNSPVSKETQKPANNIEKQQSQLQVQRPSACCILL